MWVAVAISARSLAHLIAKIFQNCVSPRLRLHQRRMLVVANFNQPVAFESIVGWWSPSVDVRVVVLLRPSVFVNELPSPKGPGQRLDCAEHVVVGCQGFDQFAGVLVELIDGVEALVGAVVP